MNKLLVFGLFFVAAAQAFLFPSMGGGGGCGCAPPPKPCCPPPQPCCPPPPPPPQPCCPPPPPPPQPCCPPPPPPPQPCCPPPPPPPQPCCPPPQPACGGGCGRKKRDAAQLVSHDDVNKCNSEELRQILIQNVGDTLDQSLKRIKESLSAASDYVVVCSKKPSPFTAEADEFCQLQTNDVHCTILRINTTSDKKETNGSEQLKSSSEDVGSVPKTIDSEEVKN